MDTLATLIYDIISGNVLLIMNASLKTMNAKTAEGHEKCGAWRILREIGRGAYGVVYLAEASDLSLIHI